MTNQLTTADLAAIRAREEKATPGDRCAQCGCQTYRSGVTKCEGCDGHAHGYRAALEDVRLEIREVRRIRWGIGDVSDELLARIARLEKEHGA